MAAGDFAGHHNMATGRQHFTGHTGPVSYTHLEYHPLGFRLKMPSKINLVSEMYGGSDRQRLKKAFEFKGLTEVTAMLRAGEYFQCVP